jgi:hypothetical protein
MSYHFAGALSEFDLCTRITKPIQTNGIAQKIQTRKRKMKKFNFGMSLLAVAVCTVLSINPVKAHADTVQMTLDTAPDQDAASGQYVYPYNFTVSGSSITIPLMCVDYYNHINFGETWNATLTQIAGDSQYEEAAYIFSQAAATGASSDQITVAQWSNWALFETQESTADFISGVVPTQYQGDVSSMLQAASNYILANPNASIYSQYKMYVPSSGWPSGDETPQDFIGDAPTPEPGSFILFGTGLLGLAAFWLRRRRVA